MRSAQGLCKKRTTQKKLTGDTQNKKKQLKEAHLCRIFDLGVRKRETTLICGNIEGCNYDLGVRKYQKVENL